MKILDTNLGVFGTLGTNAEAVALLERIEAGELTSAINAYMVQEALDAFDRTPGLSTAQRDEFKTTFLARLVRMAGLVEAPSSRDVYPTLLEERRSGIRTRLLAAVLEIQPKDVPIVTLAFEHAERDPTTLTNDAGFAELNPAEHNFQTITVEYVEK